jgi:hypothetical protein
LVCSRLVGRLDPMFLAPVPRFDQPQWLHPALRACSLAGGPRRPSTTYVTLTKERARVLALPSPGPTPQLGVAADVAGLALVDHGADEFEERLLHFSCET